MALSLDRKAFIDIITDGQGDIGGVMLPPPEGVWGMPPEILQTLPGYDPDVARTAPKRARLWKSSAMGPTNGSPIKVSTRNIPSWRDPAVLLIDQLKEIYIDAELDVVDTTQWYPRVMRKDYTVGLQCHRERGRRPRPGILRELCLRRANAIIPAIATRRSTS